MKDEQIRMILRITSEEAGVLLDQGAECLYRDIQDRMVELVREYGVRLPLNCLQFLYYEDGYIREPCRWSSGVEVTL